MKLALVGIYTSLILDEDTNHHMPVLSQILGLPEHHWGVPLGGGCGSNIPIRTVWRENLGDKVLNFFFNVLKNSRGRKVIVEGPYQQDDYLALYNKLLP